MSTPLVAGKNCTVNEMQQANNAHSRRQNSDPELPQAIEKKQPSNLKIQPRIELREATKADLKKIVEIEQECFSIYRLALRQFAHLLQYGKCDFIVCHVGGQLAGYAISLYRKNSAEARIYSIAIHSRFRQMGLGLSLLEEICSRAAGRDCKSLRLEVDFSNEVARTFYKKNGFLENGIIKDYYGKDMDAVRFKKIL